MLDFQFHPHLPEISADILVYEKGWVIQYSKSPAIIKVELTDL